MVDNIKAHVTPGFKGKNFKTLECQIMDIADDIAYSVFDFEDSLKAGFVGPANMLFSSEELLERVARKANKVLKKKISAIDVYLEFVDMFENIEDSAQYGSFIVDFTIASEAAYNIAHNGYLRTELTSQLVGKGVASVEFFENKTYPQLSAVRLNEEGARRIEIMKHYTFEATVRSSRVKIAEYRGYELVSQIFDALSSQSGELLMPDDVRKNYVSAANERSKKRVICDFIAGMTDKYAVEFCARLHSDSAQSIFKPF